MISNLNRPADGDKPLDQPNPLDSVAIEVTNLSKHFAVDSEPSRTLKERLLAARANSTTVHRALSDVSFTVNRGETFGILGHNGSGKSTLLKIMAGTYRPTTGRIRVRGRLSALLELGAGFHPDLTGRENVYLNGSILGFSRSQIDELFDEIVDFAGIEEFIDLQVKYYSSGMTARLGFAVATNLHPDVLLVDEVLAVGDEAFQAKCMERVHRFRSLGRTMVLVSHSAEAVRELCSRALVLHKGEMLFVGDVDEAIKEYRVAVHGPRPAAAAADQHQRRVADGQKGSQSNPTSQLTVVGADVVSTIDPNGDHPADSETQQTFAPGDSVAVDVRYQLRQPTDYRIRLIMRTEDNRLLVNASSERLAQGPLPDTPGEWIARFDLQNLPLLDGTYWFTVAVESLDGKVTHDRFNRVAQLVIKGPGAGFGLIEVDVACQVRSAPALVLPGDGTGVDDSLASERPTGEQLADQQPDAATLVMSRTNVSGS